VELYAPRLCSETNLKEAKSMKKTLFVIFFIVMICGQFSPIFAETSAIDIKLHANKQWYSIGEQAIITLVSDKDCYFVLYSIDSNGEISVLCPSSFCPNNFLSAKKVMIIKETGGNLVVQQGPSGVEYLQVVAFSKNPEAKALSGIFNEAKSSITEDPSVFVDYLAMYINKQLFSDGEKPGRNSIKYTVVDKN
jgi:hypothetical protein